MFEYMGRFCRKRSRWRRKSHFAPHGPASIRLWAPWGYLDAYYRPGYGWRPHSLWRRAIGLGIVFPPVEMTKPMKRRQATEAPASKDGPSHLAPIESDVLTKCHNIVAHCCVTRYDDGEARVPGWVTIKTQGSAWVVQCKDPDSCCSLQAIGQTLDDALALADLLLGAESAPWEVDRFLQAQKRERKK